MNPRASLKRKITYLALIVLLLFPLYWLSQPPSPATRGNSTGSPGGWLSRLRDDYKLNQTQLGEIDPTSESVKLATLGLRGVACTVMWEKANTFKMKKDWTNLGATLAQIAKLQPNFVAVWRHQAWNQAYNVSAEFDDYRDRYHWVMRGVDYLEEGIRHNSTEPILVWDVGWTIGQKMGRSDESYYFRKLFKQDDQFHGARPEPLRDSWLVAKEWFLRVVEMTNKGMNMQLGAFLYRSQPAKTQMNYAENIEKDGVFGERAVGAWERAFAEWNEFGNCDLPSADGQFYRFNGLEPVQESIRKKTAELNQLVGDAREKLIAEKRAALTEEQRAAYDKPEAQRSNTEQHRANEAAAVLNIPNDEIAKRAPEAHRGKALEVASAIADLQRSEEVILMNRKTLNFDYWRARAEAEKDPETVKARQTVHEGDVARFQGDLTKAQEKYRQGLELWDATFKKYPRLASEGLAKDEVAEVRKNYEEVMAN